VKESFLILMISVDLDSIILDLDDQGQGCKMSA